MKPNESDFEKQLRALRPIEPSPSLEQSIDRQLSSHRTLSTVEPRAVGIRLGTVDGNLPGIFDRIFPGLRWAFAGAAAAALVFLSMNHSPQRTSAPVVESATDTGLDFESVEITRDFVAAEDGGLVYEDEAEPARLVRYSSLERHIWTHPVTGARLEVEIPREDVILVPIAMQ